MLWIILSIIIALLKSFSELTWKIFTKETSLKENIDEISLALWWRFFALIILFPIIFFVELKFISLPMLWVLVLSSICNATGAITTLKAVKYWDLSVVGPLSSLTIPLLILSAFIILWELPNSYWFIWIMLVFIGTYFLQIAKSKWWFLWPIRALFEDVWAKYMLATSVLWSVTTPLDKLGVMEYGVFLWMFYTNIIMTLVTCIYALKYHKNSFSDITQLTNIKKISILTMLAWGALVIQMFAIKLTLAVYVIAIKRASWIFSVLLWALFFKEKNIFSKLIAASIMLLWVGVITLFGNV